MATPRRSQKQISEKYQGNLRYYGKFHLWRTARFLVSFFAVCAGLAAIIVYQKRGDERFFNPGKLSTSHAALVDGCASCHEKSTLVDRRLTPAKFQQVLDDRFHHGVAFEPIDKNCEACHLQTRQADLCISPTERRERSFLFGVSSGTSRIGFDAHRCQRQLRGLP